MNVDRLLSGSPDPKDTLVSPGQEMKPVTWNYSKKSREDYELLKARLCDRWFKSGKRRCPPKTSARS